MKINIGVWNARIKSCNLNMLLIFGFKGNHNEWVIGQL